MLIRPVLIAAAILLMCLPALAQNLDLATARIDNVSLGFTEKQVNKAAGWEHRNTGEVIKFSKIGPLGRVTVHLTDGTVVSIGNGTVLEVKGRKRLRAGDSEGQITQVLGPASGQKEPSTTQYVYRQDQYRLVVVAQHGKVAGFFLDTLTSAPATK